VLDVFDHYRFRAAEAEASMKNGRSARSGQFDGFLDTADDWQARCSRRLARYFTEARF
jgi:hypothetical protein